MLYHTLELTGHPAAKFPGADRGPHVGASPAQPTLLEVGVLVMCGGWTRPHLTTAELSDSGRSHFSFRHQFPLL